MTPKAPQVTLGPGPFLQTINRILHEEPIASIAYFCVWSFVLVVVCPLSAVFVLVPRLIFRLYSYGTGQLEDDYFDPPKHKDSKMAVVITGCDSGFGKELALHAADAGFVVFAGCLNRDSFEQVTVAIKGEIYPLELDVTQDEHVAKMAEQVEKWIKGDAGGKEKRVLHALVNNAGIGFSGNIDWAEVSDFQKIFDVNFFGTIRCCKALLPIMKEQGIKAIHGGTRVLNVTSVAGIVPGGNMGTLYSSSKHAAQCFTEGLRKEVADFDIYVSSINPSLHGTLIVDRMESNLLETWNKLTSEKRDEYGEGTFLRFSLNLDQSLNQFLVIACLQII